MVSENEAFAEVAVAAMRDRAQFGRFARTLAGVRLFVLAPESPALLAARTRHTDQEWVAAFTSVRGAFRFSRKSDFLEISGEHLVTLLPSGAGLLVDPAEPHGVGALFRFSAREPLNRVGAKAVSSLASASTLFWSANIDHALVVLRQSARPLPFDAGWRTPEDWDQVPGALLRVRPKPTGAGPSPRRHGNA